MRILMTGTSFPRWHGDLFGHFIFSLADALTQEGCQLQVLAPHHPQIHRRQRWNQVSIRRFRYMWPEGAEVVCYGSGILGNLKANPLRFMAALPFFLFFYVWNLWHYSKKVDLIHAHWTVPALCALPVCWWRNIPLVVTCHGSDIQRFGAQSWGKKINAFVLKRCDRIIAVSKALADGIQEHYQQKAVWIPNGVLPSQNPEWESNGQGLLWVGRFEEEKDPMSFVRLAQDLPEVDCVMVGDGSLLASCQQAAPENLSFRGRLAVDDARLAMRQARCLVMTSKSEGHPLVLLEALSEGCPVIAYGVGGIGDMIRSEDQGGVLVPAGRYEQLKSEVKRVFNDEALLKKLSRQGPSMVAALSWPEMARQTLEQYQSLGIDRFKNSTRILMVPPRVWNSMWGQEKNLCHELAGRTQIMVSDLIDYKKRYAQAAPQPEPAHVKVVRRHASFGVGLRLGLYSEWAALCDFIKFRPHQVITYMTSGVWLMVMMAWLMRRPVTLIYADDLPELYKSKSPLLAWVTKMFGNPFVARLSKTVVCTAGGLVEDMRVFNKKVSLIRNGVQCEAPTPRSFPSQKVVGFLGGFGDWVDFDTLLACAQRLPQVSFRIIGDGEQRAHLERAAKACPNVSLSSGIMAHDESMKEAGQWLAGVVPFKQNRLTDRVSPIKLYEYGAQGTPVISTPMREVKEACGDRVLYASTVDEWEARIRQLLEAGEFLKYSKQAQALAESQSWGKLGVEYRRLLHLT